jgi:CoA:oxalate CoA-transferase
VGFALDGVRVLDLSRVLAGPFCGMLLADLGAEVIKIEGPDGDDSRIFGPFVGEDSAYYRLFNRRKYGITMNLKEEADSERLRELVRRSDVLIENFRPGVMARLGLSPDLLLELNPRLIIVSISGFGQVGPHRDEPAYDLVAQAMSGLMSVTGWPDGVPTRVGISLGDIIPGLYAALGAVAALQERSRTGRGQHIDVAMLDSLVSVLESVAMRALHTDEEPRATGNDHAMTAPFSTYATKDGSVVIAVSNDRLFAKLARALDHPEWLARADFALYDGRHEFRDRLRVALEDALSGLTTAEAIDRLKGHGVPAAKVLSVTEALHQEHAVARRLLHIEADGFVTLASPLRLTGSAPPEPAPRRGQHDHLVDRWLAEPVRTDGGPREGRSWNSH